MSNVTINSLPNVAALATGDKVAVWDVSAGITGYATVAQIRGTGAVKDGGNTFTAGQVIEPTGTGDFGLIINSPAGTTNLGLRIQLAGASYFYLLYPGHVNGPSGAAVVPSVDSGNNLAGAYLELGRNSNATKPGAGFVRMTARSGSTYRVWPDNSGVLRIHTADPIYDNDAAGTVVGAQTSSLDAKEIAGLPVSADDALRNIIEASRAIRRFVYRNGAFNNEEFSGLIVDWADRYGMDRDAAHPAGRSLNVITAIGDLMLAVAALEARYAAL